MITGFNTDIEHGGVIYHVQTEDKGLETPIILSLVYVGGTILASKRAPYQDLIEQGFSDEALSERLKRQHRLICAAINSGRIDDLKKMSGRAARRPPGAEAEFQTSETPVQAPEEAVEQISPQVADLEAEQVISPEVAPPVEEFIFEFEDIPSQTWSPPEKVEPPPPPPPPLPDLEVTQPIVIDDAHDDAYTVHDSRAHFRDEITEDGLAILLLDDTEFSSGESRILRVLVVNRKGEVEKPVGSVNVSIKILGTAFRPLIYTIKTDRDGVATVNTQIPHFTTGRAAVLVRAVMKERAAELRRVIHPGQ